MFLNQLRNLNLMRRPWFPGSATWTATEFMLALAGEVGELANAYKKHLRGDLSFAQVRKLAEGEIADVVIYLDTVARLLGIDIARAVCTKFNEQSADLGFHEMMFTHHSLNDAPQSYYLLVDRERSKGRPETIEVDFWSDEDVNVLFASLAGARKFAADVVTPDKPDAIAYLELSPAEVCLLVGPERSVLRVSRWDPAE